MLAMADGRRLQLWQAATPDTPIHPFKEFLRDLSDSDREYDRRSSSSGVPVCLSPAHRLLAAVKVVPLATSAAPVIVGSLSVGKVIGILGLHVVETSGLVEVRRLCV